MSQKVEDHNQLKHFRKAAAELNKFSEEVGRRIEDARQLDDIPAAQGALSELQARTEEFKKLRETLTPENLFLAKYNVEVHGPHEVSFVRPQGVSRMELLEEANGLVRERALIWNEQLELWSEEPRFLAKARTPELIRIDGHVEGGDKKTRREQEQFLAKRGLTMAPVEDLAAAFAVHYIATKQPLFGWTQQDRETYFVRAAAGQELYFNRIGLNAGYNKDSACYDGIAVAARLVSGAGEAGSKTEGTGR